VAIPRSISACAIAAAFSLFAIPAAGAPTPTGVRAEIARLSRQLAVLDQRAGAAAAAHNRALDRLDEVRTAVSRTESDLISGQANLDRLRASAAARLSALYRQGDPDPVAIALASGDASEIEALLVLQQRLADQDARIVVRLRERKEELKRLRLRLVVKRTQAKANVRIVAARRLRVEQAVSARRSTLRSARADLRRVVAADEARKRSIGFVKRTAEVSGTPGALPPGVSHVFPIQGASHFTDDWLYPRPGGRYHEGIDLFASRGAPLVAVATGSVYRIGWNTLGGRRLWLRDDSGTTYYYAHLEGFAAAATEGNRVEIGTVIGYAGDSGSAVGTGVHLHFEIHPGGGAPTRPYPYVTSWPRL
jgi:peptidoglycan LD-endopeptidase LytH